MHSPDVCLLFVYLAHEWLLFVHRKISSILRRNNYFGFNAVIFVNALLIIICYSVILPREKKL